ncbi:hypothetical protein LEP1GSC034_4496 [Leptospira interrogans str. 2003000735]|uniref:Uncharacterized protein n=6 Tax=Leptospira interrogans TaxID=173 RepID=A0A0E2D4W3_LEPIR|nr:hypothetical protein LEP1GSC080_0098 [Leptospira interrogans str. FPW2026]EKN90657.1 hypothetical protein LEP1GSC027_2231 [Leptospira interrogans str. 2002000624]EKO69358.1 hypothetical protein LEP1GSC069_3112 [Leptospira interrogans serovar Canicola str. Fiocruz LV133]EKO86106.1 hypothetical protein LEP1GSC009_3679 [Leptospira interrogans serovar Grippotyphosa str. Andaman]EKP24356.1 hypothetical protein LEP1GSC117_1793 [Leptospira interrogans serovar Icterohaemorrhagiae str. Verdun LP]EKP
MQRERVSKKISPFLFFKKGDFQKSFLYLRFIKHEFNDNS